MFADSKLIKESTKVSSLRAFYSLKGFVTSIITWSNDLFGNLCLVYESGMVLPLNSNPQFSSYNFSTYRISI